MFGSSNNNSLGPKKPPPPPPVSGKPKPPTPQEYFTPEVTKIDHTNVATQIIPMEQQGGSNEFLDRYGLQYDMEEMNLPSQFIEFDEEGNAVPEEKQPERVQNKFQEIHQNFLGDKAYQEMVNQNVVNEKIMKSYDPNSLTSKMGDMMTSGELGKMNEIEKEDYMMSYLLSQNLIGKASGFLTGVMQSATDPSRTATEHYQDIMQGHQANLMKYHPNTVQSISLDIASLGFELPLFNAFGMAYSSLSGGATGLKYAMEYANRSLIRGGMAPAMAEKYSLNAITSLNRMYQSGSVLGTHAGLNDVAQQVADGATLETVDWERTVGGANRMTAIGMGIGAVGFGGQFFKHSLARTKIADMAIARRLATAGIDATALGGEISLFTYGDAFLDSEKRVSEIGMQDWIHNTGIILGLRGMHARVGEKLPKKVGMFTPEESAAIGKNVRLDPRRDPFKDIMAKENGLESIMLDPDVPFSAKQKLAERGNMSLESGPISTVRYRETPDGRAEVRTFDVAGNLLEYKTFSDKASGLRAYELADGHRIEVADVMELNKMSPDAKLNIAGKMRSKGLEKDFFDQNLTNAFMKPRSARTVEETKAVNSFKDALSEYRTEQIEAAKEAQGKAEGESKKIAEDTRGEVTRAIDEIRKRTPYTDRDVMLNFEHTDRLRAEIEHPVHGIDKILKDLQAIKESGNYSDASIQGKGLGETLGRPRGEETIRIKNRKELTQIEEQLQDVKRDIQSELSRRKSTKEAPFEQGNFELGRKAFETKQELFTELDRFPSLDNLPEIFDYKTMQAVQEYRDIQSTRAKKFVPKEPTGFERTSENLKAMAERVRKAKGAADPEVGSLQMRVPGMEKVWDAGVEIAAKSLEGGAKLVESIEKAVEYVRSTEWYKGLTRPQQVQAEQQMREELGKYTDQQIAEMKKISDQVKDYTQNIDRLKKEKPEEYWSVDRPTDKQIVEAAEQGRLIQVEGGSGIVTPDGEIIGLIKTDPKASGVAKKVLDAAVKQGANKLNAFSGYLTDLYKKNGFVTVAKVPFDPKQAPKDLKGEAPEFVEYMVLDSGKRLPQEVVGREFMSTKEAVEHWNSVANKMKSGEMYNEFFTDVSAGTKGFSDVKYDPVLKLDPETHGEFIQNYEPHRGNFDSHITKSIPGHREIQVVTGKAVVESLPRGGKVLDIGGSENSWAKGVTETSGGKIETKTVDPNTKMKEHSDKTPVKGNEYIDKPFMTGWEGRPAWEPKEKFDAVHESMTFQFISNERAKQLDYIKDKVLKEDGLLIMEEKFVPGESKKSQEIWEKNEAQKDQFKQKYFEKSELSKKKAEVIEGMHERMVPSEAFEKMLSDRFKYVYRYWDSGNFKGYVASNSKGKIEAFRKSVGEAGQSEFTSEPIGYVKGKPTAKTATQKRVDSEFQRKRNKILIDEYAALKDQLRVEGKSAKEIQKNATEVKQAFNEFISGQAWQGTMDKRASKAIWRKINYMDFTKPGTIAEAKAYVEKAVNDANFRAELAEWEAAYTKLEKFSDPKTYQTKNESGVLVGKGVSVEVQDKIKQIRERMLNEDPIKAQEEIMNILDRVEAENRNLTMEEFSKIEDLSFSGLLRADHPGGLAYHQARVQDLKDIVKTGRTQQAAKRMIRAEEHNQRRQITFDILNAGERKVELDPEKAANKQNFTAYEKVGKAFDWTFQDTWFTFLDKLSYNDKSSIPMRGYMNTEWGGMYIRAEEAHYVSKQAVLKEVESKAQEVFKTDKKSLKRILKENANQIHKMEWGEGESLDITMNQAYKRWMELQDPTLTPSLTKQGYYDQMGNRTAKYEALEKLLTPEIRSWAEWQLTEFYPKYWETVNEVYRDVYGTDMPNHGNYSPIFVSDKMLTADDAMSHMIKDSNVRGMAGNNHLKLRTGHAKELLLLDGNDVLLNYINKMEHFKAWANPVRDMNAVFGDRMVRESIRQNFGRNYLQTTDYYLDQFSGKPKHMDIWERSATQFRKNFTIGSLAFKPTVLVKQLTSFPAYMDNIPVKDFMTGLADFAANYNTATKTLNEIPYMQERYSKGWDRDVELAMKKDIDSILSKGDQASFVEVMMYLTKWGDRAAIQMGGWPVYKYHYNKGLKDGLPEVDARRVAEMEFVKATRSSQQATGPADLSQVQSGHWMFKFLTMYKTSPLQYHRKVMEGARGLMAGRGSKSENIKKMFIYHVLLPQFFQLAGNGFKWDGEDQATAAILGNFNNIFAVGDGVQYIANQVRGLPFNYQATPVETLVTDAPGAVDDLKEIAWLLENPESITMSEVMDAWKDLATVIGHSTGTPVKGVHNTLSGIADVVDGNTEYPVRRIIGWSEASLEEGVEIWDVFDGAEDEIRMRMNDKYTPVKDIKRQYKGKKKPPPPPPGN